MDITLICQTINRPSLQGMLWSWLQQERTSGDRLYVVGDGCAPAISGPGIVTREMPKLEHEGGFPGLVHLDVLLHEGVEGDYVTHIDDDDMLLPWTFARLRPFLDGKTAIILPFAYPWDPPGTKRFYREEDSRAFTAPGVPISRTLFPNGTRFRYGRNNKDGGFYGLVIDEAEETRVFDWPFVLMSIGRDHGVRDSGGGE